MISLCMIVKNEEKFLHNCLLSANDLFDEIIVVDTGSTDNTKGIAESHGAKIFEFTWVHDFSAARNFAAGQARNDWIFFLDADEIITAFDRARIEKLAVESTDIGRVVRRDHESEQTGVYLSERISRLYSRKTFHISGKIHEQITPIESGLSFNTVDIPVELMHYGYSPEVISSKDKLERNSRMLIEELKLDPDNPYLLYQLGKSYFATSRDNAKACEFFEKALAQNPDLRLEYVYNLLECLGYALLRVGRYKEGLTLAEYWEVYHHIPNFRFLLGHIYQNNAMLAKAIECFESCIGKCPGGIGSYISYYNIGVILECTGNTNDAKRYYRECGDYKPALARLKVL